MPSVTVVGLIFESAKLRPLVDMPRPGGSVTGLRPVSLVVIHRCSDLPDLPKKISPTTLPEGTDKSKGRKNNIYQQLKSQDYGD